MYARTQAEQAIAVTETNGFEDEAGKGTFTENQPAVPCWVASSVENGSLNEHEGDAQPLTLSTVPRLERDEIMPDTQKYNNNNNNTLNGSIVRTDLLPEASEPSREIQNTRIIGNFPPGPYSDEKNKAESELEVADNMGQDLERSDPQNAWCKAQVPGVIPDDHGGGKSETVRIGPVVQIVPNHGEDCATSYNGIVAQVSDCSNRHQNEESTQRGEDVGSSESHAEASGSPVMHSTQSPTESIIGAGAQNGEITRKNESDAETCSSPNTHIVHRETLVTHECAIPSPSRSKAVKFSSDLTQAENAQPSTHTGVRSDEGQRQGNAFVHAKNLPHIWASSGELHTDDDKAQMTLKNVSWGMEDSEHEKQVNAARAGDPQSNAEHTDKEGGTNPEATIIDTPHASARESGKGVWGNTASRSRSENGSSHNTWWPLVKRTRHSTTDGNDIESSTLSSRDTLDLKIIHTARYLCVYAWLPRNSRTYATYYA
jgi:hypothetical protein